ncbi:hypothetical protein PENDEC_c001G00400 [Penicillium decumbens]|uniref:Yeast cell wall synthesis Kre9/Knh1-like N-terminal domain-containing protein n=1 Tax=Penicillium decumbens TaxID=69771 RepID=A0A1V6PNT0_PENDC|nr:hypothetical protein PENDEC_c001G00400 [Penicillium decumbens]
MRAFICLAVSVLATVAAAGSQANPFNIPANGYTFAVGKPTTLTWQPTTGGTVSLRLQQGEVTTANDGTPIASNIPNDGSYTWTVPSDVNRDWYTIEIISDDNSDNYNFLPRFAVNGASEATTSSAPATTSATQTTTAESTTSTTSTTSTSISTSSSTSSTSTSAATTMTTMTTMTTATSTGATSSSSAASTSTDSSTTSSSDSSSSSTSAPSSQTSMPASNAGLVNRASGGMLALVAGAIAFL